jgi:microcystin degradation protein MlrC
MRIGVIALQHESNTFVPAPTTWQQFSQDHILCGPPVRELLRDAHHEVGGFFAALDAASDVEALPIFSARALPGGIITDQAYQRLLDSLLEALQAALPLDGLLLAPHGAAVSQSQPDADGHWLAAVRQRVGEGTKIVVTVDPHANVSRRMIDACDAMIAYRTNPHLDQRQRGIEAAELLLRTLRDEVDPQQAFLAPPVAINIQQQRTAEPPCRAFYQLAQSLREQSGVLAVSIVLGFPYADVAEMGSSVIVVTDRRQRSPRPPARKLADYLWEHRREFAARLNSVDEALREALALEPPVLLLDMGDNVGGGAPGDGTALARAMHQNNVAQGLVTLWDPAAAAAAIQAGISSRIPLSMGGQRDTLQGGPLSAEVEVMSLHEGTFQEDAPRHGGHTQFDMGPTAVVRTNGRLTIMLTSKRLFPVSLGQWTSCGIDPGDYRLIVAKGVQAPIAAYETVCRSVLRVNTPGVTTADMDSLPYEHRRRPLFPLETDFPWDPTTR